MSQGMKEQRLEGEVMLSVCLRWKRLKPILSLMVVWWGGGSVSEATRFSVGLGERSRLGQVPGSSEGVASEALVARLTSALCGGGDRKR